MKDTFAISDKYVCRFKNAVENHEGYAIKLMLIDSLMIDPTLYKYYL